MATTEPGPPPPDERDPRTEPGSEPLPADLAVRPPRLSARVLATGVVVLAGLLVVSVVVALVVLHQPRLTPLPVPSVSAIP